MASYRQSQSTYPYFCQSGPDTNRTTKLTDIAISSNFWNGNSNNLERGSACITTDTANGLVFTAPVKGLYYFKISFCCLNNSNTGDDSGIWGFSITKSGTSTNRVTADDPSNISTTETEYNTQFSTIAHLNVNDTVKMYSNNFTSEEIYLADKCYFMGYLIAGFS